jgi:soluble lytic murein transglycosylase-like protein
MSYKLITIVIIAVIIIPIVFTGVVLSQLNKAVESYDNQRSEVQILNYCDSNDLVTDKQKQSGLYEDELIHKQKVRQQAKEKQDTLVKPEQPSNSTPTESTQIASRGTVTRPIVPTYDLKLSSELQEYLYKKCVENDLEYELVLAVIYTESRFKANLVSKTNDYGLMQINKCNHKSLKKKLGITDFLNPRQSIDAGVYMLSDLYSRYDDVHQVLTAYNWGEYGMLRGWKKGTRTSKYSRKVLRHKEQLIKDGGFN